MGRAGRGGGGGSRGGSFGGSRGFSSHSGSSHRSSYHSSSHSSSHHSSHYGSSYHHSNSGFSTGYILGSIVSGSNPRRRSVSSTSSSDKTGLIIFIIVFVLYILGEVFSSSAGGSGIQKSTIEREKLESSAIVESDTYFNDTLGWINDEDEVEDAMEYFYDETGVQPFLLITDEIDGRHVFQESQAEDYANEIYDELFEDEAHLLVIFYEYDEQYRTYCLTGTEAKTVIDDEAREILLDYIDHYYYSDYDEDTMFSKVFTESADRIMKVTPSYGWIAFIFILIIVVLCVSLSWWTKKKKAKLDEMNKAQQILDQDLNTFGTSGYTSNASANVYTPPPATNITDSSEVDELKKKYDNM